MSRRYPDWFDFDLVEGIAGAGNPMAAARFRGGHWRFQGHGADFVYRYCPVPNLTISQLMELGVGYLDRAGRMIKRGGG